MNSDREIQIERWRRNEEAEYEIETYHEMTKIIALRGVIKYDIRHRVAMPQEIVPSPFVRYENRNQVIVPSEKQFIEFLRKLGYRILA